MGPKIAQFIQTAKQFLTVQETCEVVWLRHNQFVQHMVNAEGLTVDAAEKKWAEALESPMVQKSGSGQDVEVAVALPRKTVASRGKTTSTTLSLADTLDSDASLTSATKRMKLTHLCRASTDSVFAEVGAAVFKSGAASSCDSSSSALVFPTVDAVDAPAMALATTSSDLPWSPDKQLADKPIVKLMLDQQGAIDSAVFALTFPQQ